MTEWDKHYVHGSLRKPTDTRNLKPSGVNGDYIDDLANWLGRSIALVLACWLVVWIIGELL